MINDVFYRRRWLFFFLVVGVLVVYIGRLFYLQILNPDYERRAAGNAYYYKAIHPSRGVIYDRKGRLLVANKPAHDLVITMSEAKGQLDTALLASFLPLHPDALTERLEQIKDRRRNRGYSPHTPQILLTQIDPEDAARVQEQLYKFPGIYIQNRTTRQYEYQHAAHILGYLSEASPRDLERDSLLVAGDYVGKSGVERFYDQVLRGVKGREVLLRDSRGRIKGRHSDGAHDLPPENGRNLTLSIDADLQALGEELMAGKRGAIVAIEPATGEVLAMVTSPAFDPSLLSGKDKGVQHKALEETAGKPLLNRAIMGNYPPGSTFKPAQAGIFLAEGVVTPQTPLSCYGGYPRLGGRPRCHPHAPSPALVYSLATSCNSYYCWGMHFLLDNRNLYPSVQDAFDAWKDRIVALGFGYPTGVDLTGEKRGFIPNSKVYDKIYKGRWNSSTIISVSIGQGEVLATPLQIANLSALIANRGVWYTPHVVRSIEGMPLDTLYTQPRQSGIKAEDWEHVVAGMAMAVTSGTCRAANFAPGEIEVCGKTGTAENPHGRDHSAFIGFAPRRNPKIAIAVYVENGGFGAHYGVPIGRVMMEYYLREGKMSPAGEAVANQMKTSRIYYSNAL